LLCYCRSPKGITRRPKGFNDHGFLEFGRVDHSPPHWQWGSRFSNEDDTNKSKDEEESPLDGKLPAKKKKPDKPKKDQNPLITKLMKTLQLTKHVGPVIDGDLASLVDKIMREKANEDKLTELKEQYETPENCATLSERKVNQGVWNNLDESARSTDLKFQKVQKSLIKGVIAIVSE